MDKNQNTPEQERFRLAYLLKQYADEQASPGELEELSGLLQQNQHDEEFTQLLSVMAVDTASMEEYDATGIDNMILRILNREKAMELSVHRVHFLRTAKWWWAAAFIAGLLCVGGYFLVFNNNQHQTVENMVVQDVKAPLNNRAMIRLADGNEVYLDSAGNGELAKQGNISVVKLSNGKIAYESKTTEAIKDIKYNTLFNPRGSKVVDLILTDGSHVWLNAGSSITYPLAFANDERKVSITGEGYFEVAHDAAKPFKVNNGNMDITVLGTHFNVHAYTDEENSTVTLLEGSVKASLLNGESVLLKPGQQAGIVNTSSGKFTINDNVDLDAVIAWKNGWFQFNSLRVEDIMQELSRWYDVDVEYINRPVPKHFSGILSRDSNLKNVLKIMEQANMHFEIDGRKIKVME